MSVATLDMGGSPCYTFPAVAPGRGLLPGPPDFGGCRGSRGPHVKGKPDRQAGKGVKGMNARMDLIDARKNIFIALQLVRRALVTLDNEDNRKFLEQVVITDLIDALEGVTMVLFDEAF